MPLGSGTLKQVRFKKQSGLGVAAGTTGGQELRHVTSSLDIVKDTYQAAEKVSHLQVSDFRHGIQSAPGQLNGELSPGTYALLMAALLGKDFITAPTTGALTNVTAAAGPPGTFTRAAGSFITDGFRVGMIVRWTGWTTTGTANNTRNYRITALTATVMTTSGLLGEVVAAKASGDSVTCTVVGKPTYTPLTGHTNDYFGFEHWFPDVSLSELYNDVKVGGMQLGLPATGLATAQFTLLGRSMTPGSSVYFTSPTAATTTGLNAAVDGVIRVAGADVAILTSAQITGARNLSTVPVIGANVSPDIFSGRVVINGQVTAVLQDATLRDLFLNETETELWFMLRTNNTITADFLSFYMSRVKLGSAGKDDGEKALVQTLNFQALLKPAATGFESTTLLIQDSTL